MKKVNVIIALTCLILVLLNLHLYYDLSEFKKSVPNYNSANSGIGGMIIFMAAWIVNSIVCLILLVIILILGIRRKKMTEIYTLLNIGFIIFTFFAPALMIELLN